MNRRYLVAGNWKMNGSAKANAELVDGILHGVNDAPDVEILVCPPAVYLQSVSNTAKERLVVGAQNLCSQEAPGAFTGELHGKMLVDVGCRYVIVGHSERRALYGETDVVVAQKFRIAQACGLTPILCIGETLQEREANQTEAVLGRQLKAVLDTCSIQAFTNAVIAYEPVWAIGTGKTATPAQAQEAHAYIRGQLAANDAKISDSTRLLYGGSMNAGNAFELLSCADVDGGLIGGASLKAADFLAICKAAQSQPR